jgi:hypothetical protein
LDSLKNFHGPSLRRARPTARSHFCNPIVGFRWKWISSACEPRPSAFERLDLVEFGRIHPDFSAQRCD